MEFQSHKTKLKEAERLFEEAKAIYEDKDSADFQKAHAAKLVKEAKQLQADAGQLKEILDAGMLEMEHKVQRHNAALPAPEGSEFSDWGMFLKAAHEAKGGMVDRRLVPFDDDEGPGEVKQMVESVGASGGFLVPVEFYSQLQGVIGEAAIVRPRATIIRMRRRQVDIPVLDQTDTTEGIPHWWGGMRVYWAEEASEKTLTEPTFRKVSLVAHKLIGYTYGSDELVGDSAISLGDFFSGPLGFAGAIAWMEDYTFIDGNGAGQPLGIINAGATISVPRAAAGTVGFADLCDMMENFLPSGRGLWIITQSAMSEIIQMSGPAGNPSYVWQPNAREGVPGFLFGFPVIWSEKVPLIGTAGDVCLCDWKYYLIGDRQATTIESTRYDRWRYDETSWRGVHRVDGQPFLSAPLTYADSTTQVSPFVILGAKST